MSTVNDLRLRHLADIQAAVTRLSQNSFIIRGWSVTLVSVLFAIVATRRQGSSIIGLMALAPALIFWILDAYYVRRERLFRKLYAAVGRNLDCSASLLDTPDTVRPFDMNVDRFAGQVPSLLGTLFAGHVAAIPGMLAALVLIYSLVLS